MAQSTLSTESPFCSRHPESIARAPRDRPPRNSRRRCKSTICRSLDGSTAIFARFFLRPFHPSLLRPRRHSRPMIIGSRCAAPTAPAAGARRRTRRPQPWPGNATQRAPWKPPNSAVSPCSCNWFPDRQPGQHQQRTERQDQPVQQALHRVVAARLMHQAQAEGEAQVAPDAGRAQRQEVATKNARWTVRRRGSTGRCRAAATWRRDARRWNRRASCRGSPRRENGTSSGEAL